MTLIHNISIKRLFQKMYELSENSLNYLLAIQFHQIFQIFIAIFGIRQNSFNMTL